MLGRQVALSSVTNVVFFVLVASRSSCSLNLLSPTNTFQRSSRQLNFSPTKLNQSYDDIDASSDDEIDENGVAESSSFDNEEKFSETSLLDLEGKLSSSSSSLLEQDENDDLLEYSIDSFLRGEYDRQFADDATAPHPGLTPGATVEVALRSLRQLDIPEQSHGAAVLMRFCVPLSRAERWGNSKAAAKDSWKQVLRGAITPAMFSRRLRASAFSGLLDWTSLDVTEGAYSPERGLGVSAVGPSVAYVNAALFFGEGIAPSLIQFTLRKIGGVWLIDTARVSQKDLFVEDNDGDSNASR